MDGSTEDIYQLSTKGNYFVKLP
uniref:Uncharacterized protein n=1 Tax=Rhizophora mucronata TaxID=61149 RepID=A0A2P2JAH3_RHIMU